MRMRGLGTKVYQRLTNFTLAFVLALSTLAAAMPFVFSQQASAVATTKFSQGFEADTSGFLDGTSGWYGSISRVSSGTGGIVSANGGYHAIVEGDGSGDGPFTRFHGYESTWTGQWTLSLDAYLDPSWAVGEGFEFSVAANGADGAHQRDFIIHVAKDESTGELLIGGSNNTNFSIPQSLEAANHYAVPSAGWYTLQYVFSDVAGVLSVDLNLVNSDGTILFTETRSDARDTIPTEVGGNRYGWFTTVDVTGGLAIDNVLLVQSAPDTQDPTVGFVTPSTDNQAFSGNLNVEFQADDDAGLDVVTVNIKDSANSTHLGTCGSDSGLDGAMSHTLYCTIDTTDFADGTYYLRAGATDVSGNNETISRPVIFDNTKPGVTITSPSNGSLLGGSFDVTGTASDATSGIDRVDYKVTKITGIGGDYISSVTSGTATGTTNYSFDLSGLDSGYYRIKVQAFDAAGNWRYKYNDVQVDATAPSITLNSVPSYISGTKTISGTAFDYESGLRNGEIRLSFRQIIGGVVQSPYITYNVPVALDGTWTTDVYTESLPDGEYRIVARANDNLGTSYATSNTSAATADTIIDNLDPLVSVDGGTFTDNNQPTLTGTVDSDATEVSIEIRDATNTLIESGPATYTAGDTTWTYEVQNPLVDGSYTVAATASDAASNSGTGSASIDVTTTQVSGGTEGQTNPTTTTTVTPAQTPAIVGPAANAEVLGATTDEDGTTDQVGAGNDETTGVEGVTNVAAADTDTTNGTILGLAWYWWLLILAILGAAAWWIIAALRGRSQES